MENRPPPLTDFTPQRVELNPTLMGCIDILVEVRPDPDTLTDKQDDIFLDLIGEALQAYYLAGRTDVDDDAEYLGVSFRDMYRDGFRAGHAGPVLRKFLVEAVAELGTSYIQC